MNIRILQTDWPTSEEAIKLVRTAVFVVEQNIPFHIDFDENDQKATHWLALNNSDLPVGTARLQNDGHFGRRAVLSEYRNHGIGSLIISSVIEHANRLRLPPLYLNAQVEARPFYHRFGFVDTGPLFQEAGIEHQTMRLN